jgi:hypothetical protein
LKFSYARKGKRTLFYWPSAMARESEISRTIAANTLRFSELSPVAIQAADVEPYKGKPRDYDSLAPVKK